MSKFPSFIYISAGNLFIPVFNVRPNYIYIYGKLEIKVN